MSLANAKTAVFDQTSRLKAAARRYCEKMAAHRHALPALAVVSFLGGSVAPLPSDIMLVPMVMAQPQRWKFLTTVTVISSVLGALAAYGIGFWLLADLLPLLGGEFAGEINRANETLSTWGALGLFAAALLPIPFKILAVAYGAAQLSLPAFVAAVVVGRGLRFTLMSVGIQRLLSQ